MWAFDYVGSIPATIQKSILKAVLRFFLGGLVDPEVLGVENFVMFGDELAIVLSNVQLNKEHLQRVSTNRYGLVATAGRVADLRLSIAWRDILSGALSVHLAGILVDLEVAGGPEEGNEDEEEEEPVWFDAISESIHETIGSLESEVADLLTVGGEASVGSSESQASYDVTKALLRSLIRDVSVEIRDITALVQLSDGVQIRVQADQVVLEDNTEDIRASEPDYLDADRAIYVGKTLQMHGLRICILSGDAEWPFVRLAAADGSPALDVSARIFKDRSCQVEGWASAITVYAAPEYIEAGSSFLRLAANGPEAIVPGQAQTSLGIAVNFVKLEVERVSLVVTESPYTEGASTGFCIDAIDSTVTRFGNQAGEVPTTLSCAGYRVGRLSADGTVAVMCEGAGLNQIKVVLDRSGVHGEVLDRLSLVCDAEALRIQRKFQLALDRLGLRRQADPESATDASAAGTVIPMSAKFAGLNLTLTEDIIPGCSQASLAIDGFLVTIANGAGALSFQSALLAVNGSSMAIEATTVTRRLQQLLEPVSPSGFTAFDEMHTVIEEEKFLNVASAERARETQEALQMGAQQHLTVSTRGIKMAMNAADLLLLKAALKVVTGRREDHSKKPACIKLLCALLDAELSLNDDSLLRLMLSDVVAFACRHVGPIEALFDFRADVVSLSRSHQLLARRILHLSLDNSFKNIVATVAKKREEERPRVSAQISGLEFKVPLKISFEVEMEFARQIFARTSSDTAAFLDDLPKYLSLFKCSMSPEFPKTWPRCFPSAMFAENVRLVILNASDFKAFVSGGMLFLAKRHTSPAMPGIYEEGYTYWQEHGYASVCRLNFLKMHLRQDGQGVLTVDLENQEVAVEVREDSAHIIKHFFDYISNMSRYDAATLPKPGKKTAQEDAAVLKAVDLPSQAAPVETAGPAATEVLGNIEENFFKYQPAEGDAIVESGLASIQPNDKWEAILELPTSEGPEMQVTTWPDEPRSMVFGQDPSPTDVVHLSKDVREFSIDDDYFAQPLVQRDTFPFSSAEMSQDLVIRTRLHDFTVKIRLVEGSHFRLNERARRKASVPGHVFVPSFSPTSSISPTQKSLRHHHRDDYSKKSSPASRSSTWSALPPVPPKVVGKPDVVEIVLGRISCEVDWMRSSDGLTNLAAVRLSIPTVEVVDQVKRSKWKTVLARRLERDEQTPLADGSTFDTMLRCELAAVDSGTTDSSGLEYRLRVRLLPLRIHLDQDTLRYLMRFIAPSVSHGPPRDDSSDDGSCDVSPPIEPLFFQHCDIGEISLRVDYKPKRIDFSAIRLGSLAEFVNFFQLEDAELLLPAASLRGVKGSDHFITELLRAWLPYVKSTQIGKMVKGIGPVRTVINLGGGVSDLVLLPMQEWSKEGRVLRGLKRGAASFLHATALEGARLGSRLAVGTQVVLEHVDDILEPSNDTMFEEIPPSRSKYADQPENIQEGLLSAYASLSTSLQSAMQTIIAVPVQVYEHSGPEGALKAVIRAVPIAVLKPVIGATEAVSKTLMGVENTLDPARGIEIKRKYKRDDA